MSKVKRYDPEIYTDTPMMEEDTDGDWVSYKDYKRLKKELKESEAWENALRSAGVDNWQGYDYAMELLNE